MCVLSVCLFIFQVPQGLFGGLAEYNSGCCEALVSKAVVDCP